MIEVKILAIQLAGLAMHPAAGFAAWRADSRRRLDWAKHTMLRNGARW